MDFKDLVNLEDRLYYNLVHGIGSNIRNAVEYAKVNFCKYLYGFEFNPYPYSYSESIEADIYGLYKLLPEKDYKILLKHYKDLEDYEYNNKPISINDNIFLR